MAEISGLTYDQLAWCSNWYIREETLSQAIDALVNYQYHQNISHFWGGGTMSSSDGQRFPIKVSARNASSNPRYFGYGKGLTFYSWTSDQYSQYGSKVITSTIRKSQLEDQANQASALTLITNAIIVWNTRYISAIIEQLRKEGHTVNDSDIAHLSPCRFAHINKYGKYFFNVEKERNRKQLRSLRT